MNQDVQARFLRYVKVDTMSDENSGAHPSSDKQKDLARLIAQELDAMGFQRLEMDAPAAVATTAHSQPTCSTKNIAISMAVWMV